MANLELQNDEIVPLILMTMGLNRTASKMSTETEADVRRVMREGLRRFLFPVRPGTGSVYQWRWREKHHTIPAEAIYETGTVEVASGTITLTGGTWPTDATNYFVAVSGHALFISSRDSSTELTTTHSQLTVASGTSYKAYKYRYVLPSDFGEWLGGLVYADGSESKRVVKSSEHELRLRYAIGHGTNAVSNNNARTSHYAITHTPDPDATEVANVTSVPSIMFWPVPLPDTLLLGVYLSIPDDNLPADLATPGSTVQVSPIYASAVLESMLAVAEEYDNQENGVHAQEFQRLLNAAIEHDAQTGGAYDFSRQIEVGRKYGDVENINFAQQTA